MRVLHVSSYFAPAFTYGGPPKSILGLCKALGAEGIEIEVFTTTANGKAELPPVAESGGSFEGVAVRYFPLAWPRRFFGASGLKKALEVDIASFDLLHVHGIWNLPEWLAVAAARRKAVPYVISPRGMLDPGSFAHHRLRKEIWFRMKERANLDRAAFLHATSEAERIAISRFDLGTEVQVVPNGVSPPREPARGDFRRRFRVPAGRPLIVFLGRLHPTKRTDLLLSAFRMVSVARPEAVLILAGREEGAALPALDGDLARKVRWLGELAEEDKWALLAEATALVLCSDSESFGLSVVEALAVGVPVVVTRTCPWSEISHRNCGLWVEQNVESIAKGLLQLLEAPEEARRMGERGRDLVTEKYAWPTIARQMTRRYEWALSKVTGEC